MTRMIFFLALILTACVTTRPVLNLSNLAGLKIVSTSSGKVIYEQNAEQAFVPASSHKIIIAAAALHYLGPDYQFETDVLTDQISKNSLHNLYLRGSGDPTLSSNDLDKIARTLKQFGIHTITGDIVIDNTAFDDVRHGSGWMFDDMHKGFSAPTDAINIDSNRVAIFVRPGSNTGDPVRVTMEPDSTYFSTHLNASTGEKDILKIDIKDRDIYISGTIPQKTRYRYRTFAVNDPALYAGYVLQERLKEQHIHLKGKFLVGKVPNNSQKLDTITSRTLGEMLISIMDNSNNQASEALLKSIALKVFGAPASFTAGIKATQQFLNDMVKLPNIQLADASGLSRYNAVSPHEMVSLLQYMQSNFRIGPSFLASLPLYSDDKIRAKTGTMTGVCSMAGYFEADSGEVFTFAVMINGRAMERSLCHKQIKDILINATQSTN